MNFPFFLTLREISLLLLIIFDILCQSTQPRLLFFYFLNLLKLLNFIFNNLILYFIFNNLILYLIIKFINNLLKLISFFSNRKFLLQSSSHTWFEILCHIDFARLWFCDWHCRIRNECLWCRAIKSYTVSLMCNNWGHICRPPSMLQGFRQVWGGQG